MAMPPGCHLETKTEREVRYVENQPVQHWKRECSKITGCTDSADNTDWVCKPWERES